MKKLTLAVCLGTVLTLATAPLARAQAPAAKKPLAWDVVSVKKSPPVDASSPIPIAIPSIVPGPSGSLQAKNMPLRLMIRAAYKLEDEQLIGGPPWQLTEKFDINAKTDDGIPYSEDTMRERLRSLLEDRFKLKMHSETRELNASALVVADKDGKLGPSLKPSTADCSNQAEQAAQAAKVQQQLQSNPAAAFSALADIKCGIVPTMPKMGPAGLVMTIKGMGQPISNMVSLVNQLAGKSIIDKTGLTGNYDFEVDLPMDFEMLQRVAAQSGINLPIGPGQFPPYNGPTIGDILKDRLGLRLDSQKAPVQVQVIDSAEMPAAD